MARFAAPIDFPQPGLGALAVSGAEGDPIERTISRRAPPRLAFGDKKRVWLSASFAPAKAARAATLKG